MISAEFVICPRNPRRGKKLLKSLAKHHGSEILYAPTFTKDFLFMWGGGGDVQQSHLRKQRQAGGEVVFFDLGYFGRSTDSDSGAVRITFNDLHPVKYFGIAPDDNSRLLREGLRLENRHNSEGKIVLCGLGRKSRAFFGFSGMEWERRALKAIKSSFPNVPVVYRPKPNNVEVLAGATRIGSATFERETRGARLVVGKHSNVGVDCVILGVPCVVSDGLGSIIWGGDIGNPVDVPSDEERLKFLGGVSWFNWYIKESQEILDFVENNADKIRKISRP